MQVRIPDNAICLQIIEGVDGPLLCASVALLDSDGDAVTDPARRGSFDAGLAAAACLSHRQRRSLAPEPDARASLACRRLADTSTAEERRPGLDWPEAPALRPVEAGPGGSERLRVSTLPRLELPLRPCDGAAVACVRGLGGGGQAAPGAGGAGGLCGGRRAGGGPAVDGGRRHGPRQARAAPARGRAHRRHRRSPVTPPPAPPPSPRLAARLTPDAAAAAAAGRCSRAMGRLGEGDGVWVRGSARQER